LTSLHGKKIMIFVANGVDELVMSNVMREMLKTGATVKTVGLESGLVNSWNVNTWGLYFPVDQSASQTLGSDFDALIVPSGARAMQKLTASAHAERIISSFITAEKQVVMMGDAVTLFEKIGLAGAENNANVMSGDCATDVHAFISSMIAHLAAAPSDIKVAA
jgi:putative intracellular protease/amidase